MKYAELLKLIHDEALSVEFIWDEVGVKIYIRATVHGIVISQVAIVQKQHFGVSNQYLNDAIENVIARRKEVLAEFS